jgi:hypothetical protein
MYSLRITKLFYIYTQSKSKSIYTHNIVPNLKLNLKILNSNKKTFKIKLKSPNPSF